ncbi:hypothetical protein ACJJTC_015864 [Scirpophaga incertulas]
MAVPVNLLIVVFVGVAIVHQASTQDPQCDFFQNVQVGQTYYVYSPNYPNSYPSGVQCRWVATCPTGYNCRLDCPVISLPQTSSCSMDRLLVSKTGDLQLNGADYYCGQGSLTAVSTGNRISVGLITAVSSPGGRFMCQLYAQAQTGPTCSCGYRKQNRIVGGQETGVNEYPMMVGLQDRRIGQIKCGGVIISNRHALSAAHCMVGQDYNNYDVVVGQHNVQTDDSPATRRYRIISYRPHPQFTETNYDYDIAILTTSQTIAFSDRVGPVCMPFKFANADFTGAQLTILGWGTLFPGGPVSPALRKVNVDVISQSSCRSTVSTLTNRQICTYTPGKDACQDDSGGPLLYTDSATGLLFSVGIVSFGRFCAEKGQPGVNTRVPALLDWIVQNSPGANFCYK